MTTALIAAWLVQAILGTVAVAIFLRQARQPQRWPATWSPVRVLVPVRGPAPELGAFLAGLAGQDHPVWRVTFAIESADDPVAPALAAFAARYPKQAVLVVAGCTDRRGQKVHNLLAALATLRDDERAVVTLDADVVPAPGLLRALLRPIAVGEAPIATGYRWMLPGDGRLASAAVARADLAVATLPPFGRVVCCWGGATAIGRDALRLLDLPALWDRAVSDDLTLTRAAARLRLRVYAVLTARPAGGVTFSWRRGFAFGVRQHRLVRLHLPGLWWFALVTSAIPVAGGCAAAALAFGGSTVGVAACVAGLALGEARSALRRSIARTVLPKVAAARTATLLRRPFGVLAVGLRLATILVSARDRRIVWAGRRHVLGRDGAVVRVTRT